MRGTNAYIQSLIVGMTGYALLSREIQRKKADTATPAAFLEQTFGPLYSHDPEDRLDLVFRRSDDSYHDDFYLPTMIFPAVTPGGTPS